MLALKPDVHDLNVIMTICNDDKTRFLATLDYRSLSVGQKLGYTVQPRGLYGSGFSLVWGPFLACSVVTLVAQIGAWRDGYSAVPNLRASREGV